MRVKVTQLGFIGKRRVYIGNIINVTEEEFSEKWMVKLAAGESPKAPEVSEDPETPENPDPDPDAPDGDESPEDGGGKKKAKKKSKKKAKKKGGKKAGNKVI